MLKPSGKFHIWDIDLADLPDTSKEFYIVHLRYKIGSEYKETGYGMRWPKELRGMEYYRDMAETNGFVEVTSRQEGNTFYLCLRKG